MSSFVRSLSAPWLPASVWVALLLALGCSTPTPTQPSGGFDPFDVPNQRGKPDVQDTGGDPDVQPVEDSSEGCTDENGEPIECPQADVIDEDAAATDDAVTDEDAAADVLPADAYTGVVCTSQNACKSQPGTPYCATTLKQCVQCLTDLHCESNDAGKKCIKFKCQDESCTPGAKECQGDLFLKTCKPDGKGWDIQNCPDAKPLCLDGSCRLCEPKKVFCAKPEPGEPKSTTVFQCDEAGATAKVLKSCAAGSWCTAKVTGGADCMVCTPGDQICSGEKALRCADDGSGYEIHQDCGLTGKACLGGLCVDPCAKDPKYNTNAGCDYWAVDLDNVLIPKLGGGWYDAQNSQFSVIISNTKDKPALVKVEAGTGQKQTFTIEAGGLKILNLPLPEWKLIQPGKANPLNQEGTSINKNVYRITSQQPIVAYQFNPLQNYDVFSNDASMLLPYNGVGNEYFVMTREQSHETLRSYFTIIAMQPGATHVKIVSSCKTLGGGGIPALKPGQTWETDIQQGQVINIETDQVGADPTGTWIQASAPVAVFGGSEASNSPNTDHCINGKCQNQGWDCKTNDDCPKTCCADHLEEQLFPVSSWGKVYHATKLQPRGKEKDAWRILAAKNDTVVTLKPPVASVPKLAQGQHFEFETDQDFIIEASEPVQVGQFMSSANAPEPNNDQCNASYLGQKVCGYFWNKQQTPITCNKNAECPNIPEASDAKIGDPAFILGVAAEQYLPEYVFLVPDKYVQNFINVIQPVGAQTKLDGQLLAAGSFKTFTPGWQVARLPVKPGKHTLLSNQNIGLYVYGWADYVSYGYPGGAKLQ